MIHILKHAGPPNGITPPATGVHFVDTLNQITYLSVGTSSPTDWVQQGGSSSSFTNFLALLDTPDSYTDQNGKVPIVDDGKLVFDNEKLIQLKDVNDSGLSDNMVFVYDFADGQTFKPQYRMDWKDNWAAGTYKTNSVVKDQGWVMISNKETTDRAAPQPDGNSAWALSDNPPFQVLQTGPIAIQGLRFTIGSQVVTIDGFRAWRATDTGNESYSYVIQDLTDENNPTIITSGTLPQGPVGWVDIVSRGSFFYEGQVIDIKFATEVSTSSSVWNHEWTLQDDVGGLPASGTYTHSADHTLLRISVDEDDATNVKTDLDQLKIGDTLLMFESESDTRFNDYQVASAPIYSNGDTVLELQVVRIGNGQPVRAGNLCQGDAEIKAGSLPASYAFMQGYWFLNPPVGGGTVNGYLISDWNAEPDLNDDAFGLDIRGHGWVASDDWDVITTIGSGGSGGGGTGIDEFRQLVDTPNSYFQQGSKYVSVKADETGLEFVSGSGGVTSFKTRVGDVVPLANDYTASQVGALTPEQVNDRDEASINAHVGEDNPHPQYITGDELPSIQVSYLTGINSTIDIDYLQTSLVNLGNAENSVTATTNQDDIPRIISQYLREPVFDVAGTLLETGAKYTLDIDSDSDNIDLRIEFGVRRLNGTYEVLGTSDSALTVGRSVINVDVTVPQTSYNIGDTSFTRYFMIKKAASGGGFKNVTLYQEGTYTSRAIVSLPSQAIPAPHATSHQVGGSDQVNHDNLLNAQGFKSHSQIDIDLADHESRIGVNESDIVPLQQNSPPASGKVAGRFLAVANSGIAAFTITDFGSYNTDGTFRFTQKSTTQFGQGVFGDAVISGNQLTSITVLRSTGYGYAVSEVVELDIPDASENVSAKIAIDALGVGQEWQEINIPSGGVTKFGPVGNQRDGIVVPEAGDYNSDQIDDTDIGITNKFATQEQLDQISTNKDDIEGKEDDLGNPTVDDYVLSSKINGDRSWVAQSGGGGSTFDSLTDTPASKAGFAFSAPFVNAAESDLEYRKVQSELTADLNLTVDFAAGAEIEGSVYLTTQAAWDYQAQFRPDSAQTYTVTITTINCSALTDMADMRLEVLSGAWTHVTMFWPSTQVCNPAATIFTGTLYQFTNCFAPVFDGRGQSMDLDFSNRVRRTISYEAAIGRVVGQNNAANAFVIRNATYDTGGNANDVAVRARAYSTVRLANLWVLGNNNRAASCDESLMNLDNAKLLGREYGFYADALSAVSALNGPSFDDGSTLVPDVGSVDVFVQSGATCNFVNAVWSNLRDQTNLLDTVNIPMPEGVVYNNDFLNLKQILDSKADV